MHSFGVVVREWLRWWRIGGGCSWVGGGGPGDEIEGEVGKEPSERAEERRDETWDGGKLEAL